MICEDLALPVMLPQSIGSRIAFMIERVELVVFHRLLIKVWKCLNTFFGEVKHTWHFLGSADAEFGSNLRACPSACHIGCFGFKCAKSLARITWRFTCLKYHHILIRLNPLRALVR
jgi:hypothetical protein